MAARPPAAAAATRRTPTRTSVPAMRAPATAGASSTACSLTDHGHAQEGARPEAAAGGGHGQRAITASAAQAPSWYPSTAPLSQDTGVAQ